MTIYGFRETHGEALCAQCGKIFTKRAPNQTFCAKCSPNVRYRGKFVGRKDTKE